MKSFFSLILFFAQPFRCTRRNLSQQETARNFMKGGDWDNAILVLNRALQSDPKNLELQKDLDFSYYYKRDYAHALDAK
jgi:Flp pilus assembly protein TadD